MGERSWRQKLLSRKLWTAVSAFVALMMTSFGCEESEAAQVTSLIMAGATVVAYLVGEGLVDAAHQGDAVQEQVIKKDGTDLA